MTVTEGPVDDREVKQVAEPEILAGQQNARADIPKAGPDMESEVRDRIMTAIRSASFIVLAQRVRADEDIINSGIVGIANGAAVEIIRIFGMEPEFVNLRKPPISDNLPGRFINI